MRVAGALGRYYEWPEGQETPGLCLAVMHNTTMVLISDGNLSGVISPIFDLFKAFGQIERSAKPIFFFFR